jgi:hypothetical protein
LKQQFSRKSIMPKQPDSSRSSLPRPGSAAASPLDNDAADVPAPIVTRLQTPKPTVRRRGEPSTEDSNPVLIRRQSDSPPSSPFALIGGPPPSVDFESLQRAFTSDDQEPDEGDPVTIRERIERNRHPAWSVLISMAAHLSIFLMLSLVAFAWDKPQRSIGIIATFDLAPAIVDPLVAENNTIEIKSPDEDESPIEMEFDETTPDETTPDETDDTTDSENVIPNPVSQNVLPNDSEHNADPVRNASLPTGGGLDGRKPSSRARLAAEAGGTRESEMAVELGLKWILAHQLPDGSWHFRHDHGNCDGACSNEGSQESTTAATGLALMSFLGAGYTHRVGPYREQVQNGLDYLVQKMRITRHGGNLCQGESGMYSHAIATIALSEALSMSDDTGLIEPVEQARKYIESAQHKLGGWRYNPGSKGDMTVTGWQLMALKSCELSGAKTGDVTYQLAEDFISSLQSSIGCFGYQSPDENPTTTAVGILSKMYLGASRDDVSLQMGTDFVVDQRPSKTDVYFNYYATQILHHRHDAAWPKWNQEMRDYLVNAQDDSDTHRAGSWYFRDQHGQVGGRLYTTAMAVMILEVYYRYLPLYDEDAIK